MDQRFHYPGGMSQDVEDVPLLVPEDLPAGWVMPDRTRSSYNATPNAGACNSPVPPRTGADTISTALRRPGSLCAIRSRPAITQLIPSPVNAAPFRFNDTVCAVAVGFTIATVNAE